MACEMLEAGREGLARLTNGGYPPILATPTLAHVA
jgi:hypothetical protein